MDIIYQEKLGEEYREAVYRILKAADREFVPPLSSRNSTSQRLDSAGEGGSVEAYFDMMAGQRFLLAVHGGTVAGFLTFIPDKAVDCIMETGDYITTIVVGRECRNTGITRQMYGKLFEVLPGRRIITRTWSANHAHIHILESLGFSEAGRITDDRGPGIDTVYFYKINGAVQ